MTFVVHISSCWDSSPSNTKGSSWFHSHLKKVMWVSLEYCCLVWITSQVYLIVHAICFILKINKASYDDISFRLLIVPIGPFILCFGVFSCPMFSLLSCKFWCIIWKIFLRKLPNNLTAYLHYLIQNLKTFTRIMWKIKKGIKTLLIEIFLSSLMLLVLLDSLFSSRPVSTYVLSSSTHRGSMRLNLSSS